MRIQNPRNGPPFLALLLAITILTGPLFPVGGAAEPSENSRADQLFEEYFEAHLELHPSLASSLGDRRYDDRLEITISDDYRRRVIELAKHTLDQLTSLDPERLSTDRQTSRDLLTYQLHQKLTLLSYPNELLPIDSMDHFPDEFATLGSGLGVHRFETAADYENFLLRVDDFVAWVDLAVERMQEGVSRGYVVPCVVAAEAIRLAERQDVPSAEESVFAKPLDDLPEDLSRRDRRRLQKRYLATIDQKALPAYRRLIRFLKSDYLPHCRESVAWSALPEGEVWYRDLVAFWTSTPMTPDEIHHLGLGEVERLTREIARLEANSPTPPRMVYDTADDLIEAYQQLAARIEPRMKALFGPLETQPFEIVPTHLVSHYRRGSPDGSRPGRFMLSIGNIEKYPHSVSPALFLHEAIPGHHFQGSLQNRKDPKQEARPRFRSHNFESAYSEGWALYVETLGHDLGIYTSPTDEFDRLISELFRAVRLVVDTGLHSKGWTAEQALLYFQQTLGAAPQREVIRYLSLPGQALSYKLGELKILELRHRAEEALGPRFDIRDFHRQILEPGPVPLWLLERSIDDWIREAEESTDGSDCSH